MHDPRTPNSNPLLAALREMRLNTLVHRTRMGATIQNASAKILLIL
jgi:hypothetical protein